MEFIRSGLMQRFDDELKEFALITSAHGVRYIFHGKRIFIKVFFFLFWVFAVTFCITRSAISVNKYLEQKTSTRYEMVPASADAIMQFPTITICNYNKVRKSYLEDKPMLRDIFLNITRFEEEGLAGVDWNGEFANVKDYTVGGILKEGEMLNDTFFRCTQGHLRHCFSTDMGENYFVRDIDMVSGSCFRVNPRGNLRGKSGEYGVLSLYLIADTDEYMDDSHPGWIIATHEHERYGSSIDSGGKIAPGFVYSMNINTMRVKNHESHCKNSVAKESGYGRYDQSTCLLDCRDAYLNNTCGCLIALPPQNVHNYRECTLEEVAKCAVTAYKNYVINFSDVTKEQIPCNCDVVACEYTLFKSVISVTPISTAEAGITLHRFKPRNERNLALIEVYFGSSSITDIEEVIAYDFDNLLGDIGGVMGLFLGASIITVIESFTLLINMAVKCVYIQLRKAAKGPRLKELWKSELVPGGPCSEPLSREPGTPGGPITSPNSDHVTIDYSDVPTLSYTSNPINYVTPSPILGGTLPSLTPESSQPPSQNTPQTGLLPQPWGSPGSCYGYKEIPNSSMMSDDLITDSDDIESSQINAITSKV